MIGKVKMISDSFLVVDENGRPLWAENRKSHSVAANRGVLYKHGGRATVFTTRGAAQIAMRRTKRYALAHGYDWATDRHRIMRVESA